MKIFFVGSTALGHRCLEVIAKLSHVQVCGILTAPRKFSISYAPDGVINVLHQDFRAISEELNCPLIHLENNMRSPELLEQVSAADPDCILVVGWHHMIPKVWLNHWPTFGIHASLLPHYAGGAPLVWAMIEGQRKVGVSLFQFYEGVDSGPIVAQKKIRVRKSDNISTMLTKVEAASLSLCQKEVPHLLHPESRRVIQDMVNRRVYPQRKPDDGVIPSSLGVRATRNFVRAQTHPYPGAYIIFNGVRVTVWELGKTSLSLTRKKSLFQRNGKLYLGCGHRVIQVKSYEPTQDHIFGRPS